MSALPRQPRHASPLDVVDRTTMQEETLPAQESQPASSRRRFLTAGALGTLLATTVNANASPPKLVPSGSKHVPPPHGITSPTLDYDPTTSWTSPELRLARRLTMGLTTTEVNNALSMGYDAYLEYQLNYTAIDDSASENYLAAQYPTLAMTYPQLVTFDASNKGVAKQQLIEATVYRSIYSTRQLYQRMVEFWNDHFNAAIDKTKLFGIGYDRDVIRAHALDTFPNLLEAVAHSPGMLTFLDNADSMTPTPNQNYARELMELHTISVNGGYTQNDVVDVARCLTGWTIDGKSTDSTYGQFMFNSKWHDTGAKTVLGNAIPAGGGQSDGETVLTILLNDPNTANFIATKMCIWLLSYTPPQDVIDSVAQTFTTTGGDIKSMIRVILQQENLMYAPAKFKRPYHLLASVMRATGATVTDIAVTTNGLNNVGQMPFGWPEPNGYADTIDFWASLVLPRWNFGMALLQGDITGATVNLTSYIDAATPQAIANLINTNLFGGELPTVELNALMSYLSSGPVTSTLVQDAVGLALATPNFQWY